LEIVHNMIFKHELVLKKRKLKLEKTRNEYLGLILFQVKVQFQERVLKALTEFLDAIYDRRKLQRFLVSWSVFK